MAVDKQRLFKRAGDAILAGDHRETVDLTQSALNEGIGAKEFLDRGLVSGMDVVGARFRDGDMFLPEVLMAARAMKAGMALLKPELSRREIQPVGNVVLGTVAGDMHDIGKNIVLYMLEGAGFEVVDLGINVSSASFIEAVREQEPTVLGMSAFLTTTMPGLREVIEKLKEKNLRNGVKVIVGGAPVTDRFVREIGADAYCRDAGQAVRLCKGMTE